MISFKGLIFSHWYQEVNSVFPFAWCFYWKNFNIRYSWFDLTIFTWCDEAWRWNSRSCSDGTCILGKCSCLAHLCFYLQDVVKSSCSVPFEELQFDLHVFQRKITNLKRKRKRSLAHACTDHAETKQKKTEKNTIQEKQVSKSEILENPKRFWNNEYILIIMNTIWLLLEIAFMLVLKMVHCTFVHHVHRPS